MTCDDRSESVLARTLGGLTPEEDEAARLAIGQDCPPLAQVQAEADATLAAIAGSLAPIAPSAQVTAAFLTRLAAAKRPTASPVPAQVAAVLPPPSASASAPAPAGPDSALTPVTSQRPGSTPGVQGRFAPASQPAPRSGILRTVGIAGLAALVAALMVAAPYKQQIDLLHTQAESTTADLRQERTEHADALARLARAEADVRQTHATLEAKATAIAAQVTELTALLTSARAEIAKRDARLVTSEADLLASHRDVQHFQEVAKTVSAQIDALSTQHQVLTALLATAETTITALRSPNLKVIDLAGGAGQPKAWGRLLWDQKNNVWHLLSSNLAQLPAGKVYELWFINAAQQKVAAGTFTVDPTGAGMVMANVPANIGVLALAAVTDEPVGGVQVPTGSVQLVGTL